MTRAHPRITVRGALGVAAMAAVLSIGGCATADDPGSGAAGGAILGGLAGALINPGGGDAAIPAAIGAVIGGAAGAGRSKLSSDEASRRRIEDDRDRPHPAEGGPETRP